MAPVMDLIRSLGWYTWALISLLLLALGLVLWALTPPRRPREVPEPEPVQVPDGPRHSMEDRTRRVRAPVPHTDE
jgi:hypothetical protein